MKKNILLRAIPLLILVGTLLYTLFVISTTDILLDTPHYIALTLVLVNILVFYFNPKAAIVLTGLILLLGCMNVIAFTATIVHYDIGFSLTNSILGKVGINNVGLQPYSIWIFILYLLLNGKYLTSNLKQIIA